MHHGGYPTEAITEATGLTEEEITAAVAAADSQTTAPTEGAQPESQPESSIPLPDITGLVALLPWAEQHTLASVRAKAARIRQDLVDLDQRRATEAATAEAEDRIARLRADLKAEEDRLRQLKAGGHRSTTAMEAPTPIRPASGKRSREDLAAIRTWARENGHQVATAGVIKASIIDAYDAAHQTATLAKAG
jgi:hypothetical protein